MSQPQIVTIINCNSVVGAQWGGSKVSVFDWRSPESYARLETAEAPDFAWELLRRNADYRKEYRALASRKFALSALDEFRLRWGVCFRG
ncbi:DUF6499 domain-containing protein [Bradyrhizobium sp.]|uniref:transcriptional regulator domain-containing protein n=1 Tax=Bradyrhizobium sp. TaxID=376 RepID=UPI0025BBC4B8|nr:DUF6499 domain-containing protein [Bradyrhizobium sp.]